MLEHLSLRLRVFLFFAALASGTLAAIGAGLWLGFSRLPEAGPESAFVMAGLVAGFGSLGLTVWVWLLFDENVARAIQKLAGGLRARAHAEVEGELDHAPARYLGDLAPAAQAVAGTLATTRNALAEAVERETTRLALENARLSALLADVPAGVFLCSADHQIVFYNGPAQALFPGALKPGLDRSMLDFVAPGALCAARERLARAEDPDAATDLVVAATGAATVFAGRMRLVQLAGRGAEAPGYVLTLRDVTADLALHAGREALLAEIFDRVRRPAANLQTVLAAGAGREAQGRAALLGEVEALAGAITDLGHRYDAARGSWWPMGEIRAADLAEGVAAQLARDDIRLSLHQDRLMLRCDAVQTIALLAHLGARLVAEHGARALSLHIAAEDAGALITLGWTGAVLPVQRLDAWLVQPLDVGLPDVTGLSALEVHGTEAWPEAGRAGRALLRLPVRAARPADAPETAGPRRAAVYDFDLMTRPPTGKLAETPLRALTCVVFDTETTGLLPSSATRSCRSPRCA
jgi:DNA polymerase-3 subunit epsilon